MDPGRVGPGYKDQEHPFSDLCWAGPQRSRAPLLRTCAGPGYGTARSPLRAVLGWGISLKASPRVELKRNSPFEDGVLTGSKPVCWDTTFIG